MTVWPASISSNPSCCAVLQGLYRSTQSRKQAEFLARDFEEPQHRQAAQASQAAVMPCEFQLLPFSFLLCRDWSVTQAQPTNTHRLRLLFFAPCRRMLLCCWGSIATSWQPLSSSWVGMAPPCSPLPSLASSRAFTLEMPTLGILACTYRVHDIPAACRCLPR